MKKKFYIVIGSFVCLLGGIGYSQKSDAVSDYDIISYDYTTKTEKVIPYEDILTDEIELFTESYNPNLSRTGPDGREKVENTKIFPYSPITFFERTYSFESNGEIISPTKYGGSGVLINEDTVLTAAHIVLDHEKKWWNSINVCPGRNGAESPFGKVKVKSAEIPRIFKEGKQEIGADFAILKLDKPIGRTVGWYGITSQPNVEEAFTITGFPGEKEDYMYTQTSTLPSKSTHTGQETWQTDHILFDDLFLKITKGNSGSPFYNGKYQVAGVASHGADTVGIATRLNNERYNLAYYWATGGEIKELLNVSVKLTLDGEEKEYTTRVEKGATLDDVIKAINLDPKQAGKEFVGWSSDPEGNQMLNLTDVLSGDVSGNVFVYGQWKDIPKQDEEQSNSNATIEVEKATDTGMIKFKESPQMIQFNAITLNDDKKLPISEKVSGQSQIIMTDTRTTANKSKWSLLSNLSDGGYENKGFVSSHIQLNLAPTSTDFANLPTNVVVGNTSLLSELNFDDSKTEKTIILNPALDISNTTLDKGIYGATITWTLQSNL